MEVRAHASTAQCRRLRHMTTSDVHVIQITTTDNAISLSLINTHGQASRATAYSL